MMEEKNKKNSEIMRDVLCAASSQIFRLICRFQSEKAMWKQQDSFAESAISRLMSRNLNNKYI